MATAEIPFKKSDQVISEGKKELDKMRKQNPNTTAKIQEDQFILGWLKAHYDTLYSYTLAMHEEKQD